MTEPVSIRDFRKHLAEHMNGQTAVLIGDRWHHRAILLPLTPHVTYAHQEQRRAIANAARESLRILGQLRAVQKG
jgi:hypothetical protein